MDAIDLNYEFYTRSFNAKCERKVEKNGKNVIDSNIDTTIDEHARTLTFSTKLMNGC